MDCGNAEWNVFDFDRNSPWKLASLNGKDETAVYLSEKVGNWEEKIRKAIELGDRNRAVQLQFQESRNMITRRQKAEKNRLRLETVGFIQREFDWKGLNVFDAEKVLEGRFRIIIDEFRSKRERVRLKELLYYAQDKSPLERTIYKNIIEFMRLKCFRKNFERNS